MTMDILDAIKREDIYFIAQELEAKIIRINDTVKNKRGKYVTTPLVLACELEKFDVVEILLKNNADPNKSSASEGVTPLYIACRCGNTDIIELLLAYGAKINQPIKQNKSSPIFPFIERGEIETIKYFIQKEADLNIVTRQGTPLIAAVEESNMQLTKLLLQNGANVNGVSKTNETPIHKSVEKQYISMIELLHEHGANISIKHHGKYTLLHTALRHRKNESLKYLLLKTNGRDVNIAADGRTPLGMAAETDNVEAMKLLLTYGAKVNQLPASSNKVNNLTGKVVPPRTALMCACAKGHRRPITLLLENSANVNEQDYCGNTALHTVLYSGCTDSIKKLKTCELLFKWKANPMLQNNLGVSPFYYAVRKGILPVIEACLNHGSNPNHQDELGETPLHRLVQFGSKYYDVLMKYRVDINKQDDAGQTVLHLAAMINLPAADIQSLVNHGATVIRNKNGELPIHLASSYEVFDVFHRNKHDVNAQEDKGGDTVLHRMVRNAINLALLRQCVESAIFDLEVKNKDAKTVVELARQEKQTSEVLKILDANRKTDTGAAVSAVADIRKNKIQQKLEKESTIILKKRKKKTPLSKKKPAKPSKRACPEKDKHFDAKKIPRLKPKEISQASKFPSPEEENSSPSSRSTSTNTKEKINKTPSPSVSNVSQEKIGETPSLNTSIAEEERHNSPQVESFKTNSPTLKETSNSSPSHKEDSNLQDTSPRDGISSLQENQVLPTQNKTLSATTMESEKLSIDMTSVLSSEEEFFEEEKLRRGRFCSFYESTTSDEGEILYIHGEDDWTDSEYEDAQEYMASIPENDDNREKEQTTSDRNAYYTGDVLRNYTIDKTTNDTELQLHQENNNSNNNSNSSSSNNNNNSNNNNSGNSNKNNSRSNNKRGSAGSENKDFTLPDINKPPKTQQQITERPKNDEDSKKSPHVISKTLPDVFPKSTELKPLVSTESEQIDIIVKQRVETESHQENSSVNRNNTKSNIPTVKSGNNRTSKLPIRKTTKPTSKTLKTTATKTTTKKDKSEINDNIKQEKQTKVTPHATSKLLKKRNQPNPLNMTTTIKRTGKDTTNTDDANMQKKTNNTKKRQQNPDVIVLYEKADFMKATQISDHLNRRGRVNTSLYPEAKSKNIDTNELQELLLKAKLTVVCLTKCFIDSDEVHVSLKCVDKSHKRMIVVKLEGEVEYEKSSLFDLLRAGEEEEDLDLLRPFDEEMSKLLEHIKTTL